MKNLNKYIVYKHTSPSGKVYIGITARTTKARWENGKGYRRNVVFANAIKKYGWENIKHDIILENISQSEAYYTEKYLIRWYKLHKISYNITDGGEGALGVTAWNKGIPCSEETKRKIGKANSGCNSAWWHKDFSEEHKRHISESKKGIATKVPKVLQFTMTGEFVKEYSSISEASSALGIDGSAITKCCRGKRNKVGNFKWRYKYENKNNKNTKVA